MSFSIINTQYLLLGVWTSQSGGLWSRFTMPKHRGQKTWTGKTVKPNSMCEQGSVSLRRSRRVCAPSWIAHHFWLAAATTSCPPYRRTCLGVVNIITEYGTLPSCCTFSSPLDPFTLLYPQPQRCAILFLFTHSSVQHSSSAIVLLWSQACHQGSQLHYLALPWNALFVLRDSSHTSCKHGGKLSDCSSAFTSNSARNSQSRDELLLGLPTVRRRAWSL